MVDPSQEIPFAEAEPEPVLGQMADLSATGTGWINLLPEVEDESSVPPGGGLFSFLAARGPAIPLATWSAEPLGKRGSGRATIGLQHAGGPRALNRLTQLGLGLRPGWIKVQDHPRRGLVITLPADQSHGDVLHWLLSAAHALSAVALTGDWLARVYAGDAR